VIGEQTSFSKSRYRAIVREAPLVLVTRGYNLDSWEVL
jgi:hypothetical protein